MYVVRFDTEYTLYDYYYDGTYMIDHTAEYASTLYLVRRHSIIQYIQRSTKFRQIFVPFWNRYI
mgnify:CR=1 FL=1